MPRTPQSGSDGEAPRVPAKILLDTPSEDPVLDFPDYASALAQIIEGSDPQFSIGIFGGWGSGKTTLMQAIKRQLDDHTVQVWFNAWRYEKEEHLIVPLLDVLRDELVSWADEKGPGVERSKTARDQALKAAAAVGKATRALVAGLSVKLKLPVVEVNVDADKALAEWGKNRSEDDNEAARTPQSPYHASFKALKESLGHFTTRNDAEREQHIVIFIDDLDRCMPANALQVLESMKLFFDQAGVVFVVGLDQRVVEAAIDWQYRRSDAAAESGVGAPISGTEYLKKLFQVPFALPEVSPGQLDGFLTALSDSSEHKKLMKIVRPHLDFIASDSRINPREIKRYINSFILQKLIDKDLDDDVTLVLLTISFRPDWQIADQVLQSERSAFIKATRSQLKGDENALRDLDQRLGQLPDSFFDYIRSKAGRKLTDISPDRLDQQVRALEVTRSPSTGQGALSSQVERMRQEMNKINLGRIHETLLMVNELRDLLESVEETSRSSAPSDDLGINARGIARSLRNHGDTIAFLIERNPEVTTADFREILEARSEIVDGLDQLKVILEVW